MASDVALIPREILFGNPVRMQAKISPDGNWFSYIQPDSNNILNVFVEPWGGGAARQITRDRERGVRQYDWSRNSAAILYHQDTRGDENWHLRAADIATGNDVDCTPFPGVQAHLAQLSHKIPHMALVAMNKDNPQLHDIYRLDLRSGALELAARNPGNFTNFIADDNLRVLAGEAMLPNVAKALCVRASESGAWRELCRWDHDDVMTSQAMFFSSDARFLYLVDTKNSDCARLVKLDAATGALGVVHEFPGCDQVDVLVREKDRAVQAVAYAPDRLHWHVLDETVRADFEALAGVQRGDLGIVGRDYHDTHWIASFTADNGPVSYYAYDRATRKARFLFDHRPQLRDFTLAVMEPVTIRARDGLSLPAYITFPPNVERKNLPMVLNVHGGPWHRDHWGLNSEAQWLANRGYICLQVNFRGSTGYGKKFLNAANREWGGKMHDDLIDAVNWAVKQGWADSKRVAIYGGSYGGYSALAGATFTPEVFRCSVAIVGPSNLITFMQTIPPYWELFRPVLEARVGHPERDREFLLARSPLTHVDKIRIPMLIAHGANDPRVKQAESEQIVAAMKAKGIDHEYLLFPDEGHGFAKPHNRLRMYARAEAFFAKHLGGRMEAEGPS